MKLANTFEKYLPLSLYLTYIACALALRFNANAKVGSV